MTLVATLLLSALPQVLPGNSLKLPPKPPGQATPAKEKPQLSDVERFRRDLLELQGSAPKIESKLEEIGRKYPNVEALIIEVARSARAREMAALMPVARRFGRSDGSRRVGDELLFELLARPLGDATRPVLEAMAELKGSEAKEALAQCLRARIPAVRRQAVAVIQPLLTPEDLPLALELSRDQSLDLQLRGVELLRALGGAAALERLLELLAKDPAIAAAACSALIQFQHQAVPMLVQCSTGPAVDRSWCYAAFALAQIGRATGADVLPAELAGPLARQITAGEPLARCLAAIALADIVFHSDGPQMDGGQQLAAPDAAIVEALLLAVEPRQFLPNIDLLRLPAEQRLLRHTGRIIAASELLSWRDWWQAHKSAFLGTRARVLVDERNAAAAIVTLRQDQRSTRVIGEAMADVEPVPGATEVVLSAADLLDLVHELQANGFGDRDALRYEGPLPRVRSLQVQVPGGRSLVAVSAESSPVFDRLVATVLQRVDAEAWQLYRLPADEPDRAAFWRAERRWLDGNPDPLERGRRFLRRLLRGWSQWSPDLLARGIAYLASHPERGALLTEADGELAIAALQQRLRAPGGQLGPFDLRLLEFAATAPGDRVWRACVGFAVQLDKGSRDAVRAVFALLGPDAVLAALADDNATVRRAAIDEIVTLRDPRAAPRLVQLLEDPDLDVRRGAVFACGQLQIAAASRPVVALIAAEDTPPLLRRDCLRALGRIGGELAFQVLQRAVTAPSSEDKEAAMRGLGELRDPRAAHLLAELVVVGHGKDLGALARFHLQRQGVALAVPALRGQLPAVQDEQVRAELVLLLGFYQDPANVPDLMDLLRKPRHAGVAAELLEGTTGVDLANAPDRIAAIEAWWRRNRQQGQWRWLLDALAAAGEATTLQPEQFAPGADLRPVPELARLLVESGTPRLRVLSAAVLRSVTGQDFGSMTAATPVEAREAMAMRYRMLAETDRAAVRR